jgi:hypothetical protein
MRNYYEFPTFCEKMLEFIEAEGGFVSEYILGRKFRSNQRRGFELENAIKQLAKEHHIRQVSRRTGERGPAATGWEIME